jgi:hypothetical protein
MSSTPDGFVPLAKMPTTPKAGSDMKATVLPQARNAQPFRALGQASAPAAPDAHGNSCEPKVLIQRDGDRVSSIQVHCSCGEVIELACVY